MSDCNGNKPPRRKGITSMTLHWIAEKFRRAEQIKDALARGTYQVDSDKIAQAIVNTTRADGEESRQ